MRKIPECCYFLAERFLELHKIYVTRKDNDPDFWIYSKVPTLNFATEYRTIIFRKYLTILLMKYRDNVQKYISSAIYEKMDEQELWKSILSLLNKL